MKSPTLKVADVFVETLVKAGVRRIYGVTGDSLNGLTDAVRKHAGIDWQMVRHEEVAAFAASAEAQMTGGLAVCAGSCGPGNLHLINGLHDAHRSRVPVLAIAAHIPSAEIGTNYFQETKPEQLFATCAEFCETVSVPEQIPRVLAIAMRTALARRCVAVVVIPGDVLTKAAAGPAIELGISGPAASVLPPPENLRAAADLLNATYLLNATGKVTILAGAGCAWARTEVLALAEVLQAPVISALRGKESLEWENPYYVGLNGLLGMTSAYKAMEGCDTLLMLGTDFPYSQFYPQGAKVVQVDLRGEQIGRRTRVDVGLIGDVKYTLQALTPLLKKHKSGHLQDAVKDFVKVRKELDARAVGEPGKAIHPQYLTKCLSDLAAEDAVFLTDTGTPTTWGARYLRMNGRRRLLGSYNHGTMANAMPMAIGVQLAAGPGRQVVTLSGDGGISMLLGDLLTLRQSKLPVKVVVYNNSAYAFVEQEMKAAGYDMYGTEFAAQDYAAIARAAGIFGVRCETAEQVMPALREAFAHAGPAVIDVVVARQELSLPPTVTAAQAAGFSLYMLKAMLHGDGSEVLDMAKTNLLGR